MRPDTDFSETIVVPRLSAPQPRGKNVVYCAAFRMAWRALCERLGGPVALDGVNEALLAALAAPLPEGVVDAGAAYAWAGSGEEAGALRGELAARGGEAPTLDGGADVLVAFARLEKRLAFPIAFSELKQGLYFRGRPVDAFGVWAEGTEEDRAARARQVRVHHYGGPQESVLELLTGDPDDRLFVARVEPGRTLEATTSRVMGLVKGEGEPLEPGATVSLPCVEIAISRSFRELTGRKLTSPGCVGCVIGEAREDLQFRVDARGATVLGSAVLAVATAAPPRAFHYTQPFAVLLVRRGCAEPYLALWVETPELLVAS